MDVRGDQAQRIGREGGVSTQSQGRGHGEGGGVQYQTLNSEIAHILGREVGAELQKAI